MYNVVCHRARLRSQFLGLRLAMLKSNPFLKVSVETNLISWIYWAWLVVTLDWTRMSVAVWTFSLSLKTKDGWLWLWKRRPKDEWVWLNNAHEVYVDENKVFLHVVTTDHRAQKTAVNFAIYKCCEFLPVYLYASNLGDRLTTSHQLINSSVLYLCKIRQKRLCFCNEWNTVYTISLAIA
jgi:hypothetical protein